MFITFEGIGGCGKSTQVRKLFEKFQTAGLNVITTREPGGSPGAEDIRRLILEGEADRWTPETEILLFNAARLDHLERVVRPALRAGKVVVSDRYVDSTRVYQGVARADLRTLVDQLHQLVIGDEAKLTIVIDVSAEEGQRRILAASRADEDRFDEMGLRFQQQLRDGYLALADEFSGRVMVIDGHDHPDVVAQRVWAVVAPFFPF